MINKNKPNVFTEFGFGNDTFINSEIEYEDGSEKRFPGFIKMQFHGIYFRIWIGYKTYCFSIPDGLIIKEKSKKKFKLLFGISGHKKDA